MRAFGGSGLPLLDDLVDRVFVTAPPQRRNHLLRLRRRQFSQFLQQLVEFPVFQCSALRISPADSRSIIANFHA
jgi:hypothetical protein